MFQVEVEFHNGDRARSPECRTWAEANNWLNGQLRDSAVRRGRILQHGEPTGVWRRNRLPHVWEARLSHGGRNLVLNGVTYAVEVRADHVELVKPDETVYVVERSRCGCPWALMHPGMECKHRIALGMVGLTPAPAKALVLPAGWEI